MLNYNYLPFRPFSTNYTITSTIHLYIVLEAGYMEIVFKCTRVALMRKEILKVTFLRCSQCVVCSWRKLNLCINFMVFLSVL